MFELAIADEKVEIITKRVTISFDMTDGVVDGGLTVGKIKGAGEFEIGEMTIRGIQTEQGTIYMAEDGGIRVGIIGAIESKLDDLGPIDILVTASVKAVKEVAPKVVVAVGDAHGMAENLDVELKRERRLKIKNETSLPVALEVYDLR